MIANCPNVIAGCQTVAWGNGAGTGMGYGAGGYGAGYGAGGGMGMHAIAGCCKAACGSVLGVGILPLALVAAVGFLGYKVYIISKNEARV